MNRSVARAAVLVLIGVLALGVAAATVTSPTSEGVPGSGGGPNGTGILPLPQPSGDAGAYGLVIPPILQWIFWGLLGLVGVIALVWSIYNYREALSMAAITVLVVAVIGALILLLDGFMSGMGGSATEGPPGGGGSGGVFLPGEAGTQDSLGIPMVLAVLAVILLTAVVTFVGATGNLRPGTDSRSDRPDSDATAVGAAAGRAADRIQAASDDATVDNEVYRAWREMTALLSLDRPETRTPGEFAAAAVNTGMAEEDVSELTKLFEEVRYGNRPPDGADRETRALTVLRRIEDHYAEAARSEEGP